MASLTAMIDPHVEKTGGLLYALRAIVAARGYVDDEARVAVAEAFNLSLAEVRGIVSFYHDLRTTPPPRKRIRICRAEACQAVGARKLQAALEVRLGITVGNATPDNAVGLESVYCLGLCANGPALMIDEKLIAEANEADIDEMLR